LHYLSNLEDHNYLEKYRQSRIYICCGRGSYEERMLNDTRRMKEILNSKGVDAFIDVWGQDVNHDWPWWQKQIRYFLDLYFNSHSN
jgi:esterase/lipase superfamily enzyme